MTKIVVPIALSLVATLIAVVVTRMVAHDTQRAGPPTGTNPVESPAI